MGTSVSPWAQVMPVDPEAAVCIAADILVGPCRLTLSNPR
jgi:hypothetical protein